MNDFTKEELEDILETYYIIEEHSDIERKVISKIQSLIDNYCEPSLNNSVCYCGQNSSVGETIEVCGYCKIKYKGA